MRKLLHWSVFSLSTILVLISLYVWSGSFLKYHKPVPANTFIFEGWLNSIETETAFFKLPHPESDEIIIVGQEFPYIPYPKLKQEPILQQQAGIVLLTNSSILLHPDILEGLGAQDSTRVSVKLVGSKAINLFAHFTLFVNGSKAETFFSDSEIQKYNVDLFLPEGISSLGIYYDNDLATNKEGRYLIVQSFFVGDIEIVLDSTNVLFTNIRSSNTTGYPSAAHEMKAYLEDLGMASGQIHALPFTTDGRNRTLEAAHSLKDSRIAQNYASLNIVSPSIHSRRSWITYSKVLPDRMEVGVLYHEDPAWNYSNEPKKWKRILGRMEELAAYTWNWLYLTLINKP